MAESLRKQLQVLAAFQAAQQTWDSQLDLLHATRADYFNCKQQLLQLQSAGQGLLDAADLLEVSCSVPQGFPKISYVCHLYVGSHLLWLDLG